MVQTVFAPDGDINLEQLWKDISPEQLMDSKLKCVFEPPPDMNETKEEPAAAKASPKAPAQAAVNNAVEPEQRKTTVEVFILFFVLRVVALEIGVKGKRVE